MTEHATGSTTTSAPGLRPATAGEVLALYLHGQAGDFLRSLRLHRESAADVEEAAEAARLLRRSARRISGALHVYRPLTDTAWADQLRAELAWLSGTLAREHAYAARLARLRGALHRLSGASVPHPDAEHDRTRDLRTTDLPDRGRDGDREPAGPGTAAEPSAAGGVRVSAAHEAAPGSAPATGPATAAAPGAGAAPGGTAARPVTSAARTVRRGVTAEIAGQAAEPGTPADVPPAGRAPGPARADARGRTGRPGDPVAPAAGGSAAGNGRPAESGAAPGRSQVPGARAGGRGSRRALSLTADEAPDQATGAGLPGALPDRAGPAETPARRGGAAPGGRRSGRPQADRADGPYPTDGGGTPNGASAAGDGTLGAAAPGDRTGGREPRAPRRQEQRAGALTVGAARAGALLERQLTLARTRAHTAALQALGSSRFHAVADAVALLASEVPLDPSAAEHPAEQVLPPLADLAHRRLVEAVEALPLGRAGHPYNAEALVHGLAATPAADAPPASDQQDAPWHQVRRLVRTRRYALEVLDEGQRAAATGLLEVEPSLSVRLLAAAQALERHRDAAEAATAAATAARTPRIAPATAYALGVLHADQRHEVEAARFAFGRVWQRLAAGTP